MFRIVLVMDPNVKPQTLAETFDQANSNSIPEYM